MNEAHARSRDQYNAAVGGRVRVSDCSQVTDGSVGVLLASHRYAEKYAKHRGLALESIPRIRGWGHRTARLKFADKIAESKDSEYVLPHVRATITDAWSRAGVADVRAIDGIETHDCFTTSEYMAIDHFGITRPGESWRSDGSSFGASTPSTRAAASLVRVIRWGPPACASFSTATNRSRVRPATTRSRAPGPSRR
jgi:acetyl-CoA C-acetyltransferase